MNEHRDKAMGRRDFLKGGMRAVFLAGLASTGVLLGKRTLAKPGTESACPVDLPCRRCGELSSCRKSEALSARRDKSGLCFSTPQAVKGERSGR